MSKKTFSDEEMDILRQNPFTYKVTRNTLSFTREFKELFLAEYNAGILPRQILINHGYDPEMFGSKRIEGISHHIRQQYEKNGEVYEGTKKVNSTDSDRKLSDKDELRHLQHEVKYMKQEIEFLKKIFLIKNTGK